MTFAYLEFVITGYFFPIFKSRNCLYFIYIFLPLASVGCILRLSAFITARSNFHHLIRYSREKSHLLIKHGIYAYERHPGYLGYFCFSIFSQLLIKNFLSSFLFIIILWRFFLDRIVDEENTLLYIFGEDYLRYKEEVPTYLPFVGSLVDFKLKMRGIDLDKYKKK